jgi:hypothetical protein
MQSSENALPRTINPLAYAFVGSNPTLPTLSENSEISENSGVAPAGGVLAMRQAFPRVCTGNIVSGGGIFPRSRFTSGQQLRPIRCFRGASVENLLLAPPFLK